jgi:dihydrofolate synthase/folylpolyglutamate synthase
MTRSPSAAEVARYEAAVQWVESFIRPITGTAPQKSREQWESEGPARLERMDAVMAALDHPERSYTSLHVTGTSGKGSVCTYLGTVLRATGRRVGVHSTPYLQVPLEKLQVDGRYASTDQFVHLVEEFKRRLASNTTTPDSLPYPALWVALTYLFFAEQSVDTAVVEVSTGGRFDWTNTLKPAVSVVTTVGPDHLVALGPTLADVAYHKAGIIKPGVPAVTGVHEPEARIIQAEAEQVSALLLRLGKDFDFKVKECSERGTRFDYTSREHTFTDLTTSMIGRYQAFNAALAVAALCAADGGRGIAGEQAIRAGLAEASLAGRMELVQRDPDVLLDGAHNPEKAEALASALEEVFPTKRLLLVVGALSTKDAAGILGPFAARTRRAFVTSPHVLGKSGADPEHVAEAARALGIPAHAEASPLDAVRAAMNAATPNDLICVTGSLYLVGEVRRLWVSDEAVLASGYSSGHED